MKKAAKEEKRTPRYSVGIDLGTTNSILSYVDLTAEEKHPQTLPIPQIVAPRRESSSRPVCATMLVSASAKTLRHNSERLRKKAPLLSVAGFSTATCADA